MDEERNDQKKDKLTKQPNTAAYKNEFTKGYLTSSNEIEKGYYEFESKTKGYKMLFPGEGVISEDFGNEKRDNAFEAIMYGYKQKGASVSTRITYENHSSTKDIQEKLRLLSVSVGYEGVFQTINEKGKIIYFATKKSELTNSNAYIYFSLIKSNNSDQAVEFIFNSRCKKDDKSCELNEKELERTALKIMKSVTFKH